MVFDGGFAVGVHMGGVATADVIVLECDTHDGWDECYGLWVDDSGCELEGSFAGQEMRLREGESKVRESREL